MLLRRQLELQEQQQRQGRMPPPLMMRPPVKEDQNPDQRAGTLNPDGLMHLCSLPAMTDRTPEAAGVSPGQGGAARRAAVVGRHNSRLVAEASQLQRQLVRACIPRPLSRAASLHWSFMSHRALQNTWSRRTTKTLSGSGRCKRGAVGGMS